MFGKFVCEIETLILDVPIANKGKTGRAEIVRGSRPLFNSGPACVLPTAFLFCDFMSHRNLDNVLFRTRRALYV